MPDIAIIYSPTAKHPMAVKQSHIDILAKANLKGEIRNYRDEEEFLKDDFSPEILLSWGQDTPDAACAKMSQLKWIQSLSAGIEGLEQLEVLKHPGITLGKMKNVHGIVMAQTCMTYILSFMRCFPKLSAQQRKHVWKKPDSAELLDATDVTVGIYGMGDIGSSVAKLCKAMGMTVYGCRRSAVDMEYVDKMFTLEQRSQMLPECDFVVDLVPDTPASRGSVNADFFASMKNSAVFINIGRGTTVDMNALASALQSGVIAGAALDAVTPEPLNEDSPLWDMENVIITPHCSADSPNYFDRAFAYISERLKEYQKNIGF